ncbi:hypothetical protein KVK84_06965 [Helicobacter pylori]|nr:hypothetical protein KVK84_06965 [Helicobacter pylori]
MSIDNASVYLVSMVHAHKGSVKIFHKITRFNDLKKNEQAALIDLCAIKDNQSVKNVCRVVVIFNKHQHVENVEILWGNLSKKFFEINYVKQGILFLPDQLILNSSLGKKRSNILFLRQVGGVKKQEQPLEDFTLDQKDFIDYVRRQRDKVACSIGYSQKSYTFYTSLTYKHLVKSYSKNKLISDLLGYKTVSNFLMISIFNQIGNDLKKISEKCSVDEVLINDFLEKLKPLIFNGEKQASTDKFSDKQISACIESVQQQIKEYENLYRSVENRSVTTIYLNSIVQEIIKDHLNNRWVVSVFAYSTITDFFSFAVINQIRSDLKKLAAYLPETQ